MKKITLAIALLSFGMQAQNFPSPYCDITDSSNVTVEEITTVNFAGSSITNTDVTSVLVNETTTIANLRVDDIYTIVVQGNTEGPFDNDIVAFIDWNQNDILDDAGEIYNVGTISNSTGDDSVSVALDIAVPANAVIGTTRIRITKTYQDPDSPAEINPCGIQFNPFGQGVFSGFGQALDFTLEVEEALEFPEPYCNITDAGNVTVEEITEVSFAGTTISNTDTSSVLVDETETHVNVTPGETYTIAVKGNTVGPFDTDIVAFIDWNQNDILDDTGEIYSVGTITNSTGNDNVFVSLDIMVPANAVIGDTRIRITKTYQDSDSPAEINPCGIQFNPFGQGVFSGFGQALDFTLSIEALSVNEFDLNALTVYPIPTKNVLHVDYNSNLSNVTITNVLGQKVYAEKTLSTHLRLDVSSLAAGPYIVSLTSETGQHSFRIIKQ
ncbi:GEVED domain-containing protein [Psychroserpens damuponensis]|uniref:GEVED domain-containing protein n=1 Tax=Psychroserpens damuponensis TaxID=943936 RepID=UPI000A658502|nr:GEVED domain-containing protein [Psychroserpens damuponensis]